MVWEASQKGVPFLGVPGNSLNLLHSLKLTASSPLEIGRAPKGNDRISTIHFQVQAVSFRDGTNQKLKSHFFEKHCATRTKYIYILFNIDMPYKGEYEGICSSNVFLLLPSKEWKQLVVQGNILANPPFPTAKISGFIGISYSIFHIFHPGHWKRLIEKKRFADIHRNP